MTLTSPTRVAVFLTAIVLGTVMSEPAQAHHSFAMFDKRKIVAIHGVVKQLEWDNPHVYLYVVAMENPGQSKQWTLECDSINLLMHEGWRYGDLNVGDKVSLSFYPLRDGQPGGLLYKLDLPNGKHLKF